MVEPRKVKTGLGTVPRLVTNLKLVFFLFFGCRLRFARVASTAR